MRYITKRLGLSILLLLFIALLRLLASEATEPRREALSCLFFSETGGGQGGYSVCDDLHADFRSAFEQWGVAQVGYPISRRYTHNAFVRQAFQKVIMQWEPDTARVTLVNIFDELHQAGLDDLLLGVHTTPPPLPEGWDGNLPIDQIIKKRQALLDQHPALRKAYFASDDPLLFYGMPTSEVLDFGNHYAIRSQRALLQEWKEDMGWAKTGDVTVANAGDIAKELGTLPQLALLPEAEAPSLTALPVDRSELLTPLAGSSSNRSESANTVDLSTISVALEPMITGFTRPLALVTPGDGSGRFFVVEKDGLIWLLMNATDPNQAPLKGSTAFLDVRALISTAYESGLLGMAFEPGRPERFYINYINSENQSVLARYRMGADLYTADPASGEILLTIPQVDANHNGGQLLFGPDGYLWLGLGDGGGIEDEARNAQNSKTLLGSILRLDVRTETSYTIPLNNPFADGVNGRAEVWAIGLRNPWRYSFDRMTGDLWVTDVGHAAWEEINRVSSRQPALNYGWPITEGNHCFGEADEDQSQPCTTDGFVVPISEYDHRAGCSVTGGYVYRGNTYPQLQGIYLFADYCNGNLWAIDANTPTPVAPTAVLESGVQIASFGEDEAGELYVVGFDGTLYRLVGQ